jgi:NAD(P)-dependent dehydrogenase (short-subunit alcohol dehydrogenase family)
LTIKNRVAIVTGESRGIGRALDIKINGAFRMVQAAVPSMRRRGHGHIVSLSSNVT